MGITGAHALIYTSDAEGVRAIFRDVFAWDHVDAGDGWLIFRLPPAELGIHPGDEPKHELSLMCDDLEATMAELRARGIEFTRQPQDEGYGITTVMRLPGGAEVQLYEPRHPTAI